MNKPTGALSGIFTPNVVPLDKSGRINEDGLAKYVDWLIRSGVHGLYPNGSTGEFTRFTAAERQRIVKVVCEAADGRVPVLAGAAEANARETLLACEAYAGYGARAVAIISPIFYKLSQDSIFAYFEEIAKYSVIDVTVYNIPMLASSIEVETVQRLAELEKVIGIKDSSGDVAMMARLISRIRPQRPEFTFMTGWDAVLVPMLAVGADGGTNACSGVVPELTRKIFDRFRAGDMDGAMADQYGLTELFHTMLHAVDFPDGFRAGVELRGHPIGGSRHPHLASQMLEIDRLKERLAAMINAFDCVEELATSRADSA